MKVALLCAIVFGAISAAASLSQHVPDEHFVQQTAQRRPNASSQAKRGDKTNNGHPEDGDTNHGHQKISALNGKVHLSKRVEGASILEGAVDALRGARGDAQKGGDTVINHYHSTTDGATAHLPGGPPTAHPYPAPHYQAPPPYSQPVYDPGMAARFDKIDKKLGKLKDAHKDNSQQIRIMEELQAKQMEAASAERAGAGAAAAAPNLKKKGFGKGALALTLAGGAAAGYGLTRMFDTKPSDSTTGYYQQDMAALQGAGGAAPGTAPVDGYPPGSDPSQGAYPQGGTAQGPAAYPQGGAAQTAGAAGGADNQIATGPFRIPNSDLVWVTDTRNQVHVLKMTQQGMVEVNPPPGWQPPSASGGGAAPGADSSVASSPASGGSAVAAQQGAGAGAAGAGGADAGASGAIASGVSGADQASFAQAQNVADEAGQNPGSAAGRSGGSPKPQFDKAAGMWYVIGPNDVQYYIDDQTGYLINANTGDVSNPKTGQILYRGDDLQNASSGVGQGVAGGNAAGTGAGTGKGRMQKRSLPSPLPLPKLDKAAGRWYVAGPDNVKYYIDEKTGLLTNANTGEVSDPATGRIVHCADDLRKEGAGGASGAGQGATGGTTAGNKAAAGTGRMQKRSLRHRQLGKRVYPSAAYQAASPALREQAQQAMLRGSATANSEALATAAKPGMGTTLAKGALGLGVLAALVIGLDKYAHPKRPHTTETNEYGLEPTSVCDMYGEPIIRDFRGVLWNESTYTRVDLNNPPPLHPCSQQELADASVGGAAPMQKRNLQAKGEQDEKLLSAVRKDLGNANSAPQAHFEGKEHFLTKRQVKAMTAFLPSMTTSGTMAVAGTLLITAIYLRSIHQKKLKALQDQWNSQYHSAGDAASAVGNAIATGANGQLFNPITGNLVLVDSTSNLYYDSGTGEQVNPKTAMPFKFGGGDASDSAGSEKKQEPVQLPLDSNGNMSGDSPEVQQAMSQWNAMSPQQQQQLLAQYGNAANQILNSPDPNAALQAWSNQLGQP
ncbi:hypothetical protein PHSY_003852 [Pseudozyma hubeiensis SY62]|uniref:WW domain-containing protein n=1 Tax=Pseudozyma hubeiensis (strain SY62) TaxID=1305764 RepID=R9P4V6_PSEHS|nr:hypothetical protein PHSY_003852 [Pseudozyma hubeiensis SY62]GAC96272.1 hypothetical protein PHSY_003852 [Pseudozyma hubeiensis SY62]